MLPTVRMRNFFLLAASYYFYMNWNASYALLLLTSTFITYVAVQQETELSSASHEEGTELPLRQHQLSIQIATKNRI